MMDYKKIIKNENVRYSILHALNFVPDCLMIPIQYRIKTGRRLNLKSPSRYSEKLQWYKLYYRDELMAECADKATVRQYVIDHGLGYILNDCYGIFDSAEDFPWEKMPKSFVLKDTLGGGGRSMAFIDDKDTADRKALEEQMKSWLSISPSTKNLGREWVYDGRKHRVMAEKMLIGNTEGDLPDYKFFCFQGRVFCSYMMRNYTMHHDQGELGFFDRDFNLLEAHRTDFKPILTQPAPPENYGQMVDMAEILSKGFPHVRVDFYNLDGEIIFGEMTFFNASGYVLFEPDSFDFEMGEAFILPPTTL